MERHVEHAAEYFPPEKFDKDARTPKPAELPPVN